MQQATLIKLAAAHSLPDQKSIIDSLVNESGLLRTMPFQKASHGLFHKYKVKTELPSGGFRNVNGSITPHSTNEEVKQIDLKILTDIQQEDKAICEAYPGGVKKYFADELPAFVEGLGQTAAKQFIYGTDHVGSEDGFKGLRQYAQQFGNEIKLGGSTGNSTSILVVRWKKGVCSGLYNEQAFSRGQLITIKPMNNGNPVMLPSDAATGSMKPVYQALYESYLGLLVADKKCTGMISEICEAESKKPTSGQIDQLIDLVNGSANDTFIYLNRASRRLLWELKNSKMQTAPSDRNYSTSIELWNGIPLVLEENITSNETV